MEHTIQNENQPVFLTANSGPESPATCRQAKGLISEFPSTGVTEKPSCGCCTGSHSKESTEEPDGWKVLLEAMEQADQKTLDRWKAEMDSLLIFAGLLSAVVTAFTVESYQWLTDDPASTSVILLAQISEKMNSFSVGHSFINTTLSNPPSPDISGFSVPDAVMINILWILSLTFSLIAAFFSLAVQQWLRHIPLPEDMTIRQSIRLRQFRQSGLAHWRVPMIVSFLPILVQVAVILFLIGLLYLLRPLNREIGLAFTMVAGSLLASFTVTAFLPFYYRDCPYKSSVFPTILYIIQPIAKCILYFVLFGVYIVATSIIFTIYLGACAMVMALWVPIATFVVLFSVVSILCLAIAVSFDHIGVCLRTVFSPITRRWRTVPQKLQGEFKPPISPIRHYLRSLPTLILSLSIQYFSALARHVFTSGGTQNEDGSEPWWSRVIKLLERLYEARKDKQEMVNNKFGDPDKLWLNLELKRIMLDSHLLDKLDESALASAPLTVARSDSSFIIVQKCLKDLEPTRHRALCAFKWASHHLGVVSFENEMCKYSRYSRINPSLLEKVDEAFAGRFRDILWEALPTDWSKWDVREDRNSLLGMLILLMEINAKFRHDDPDYPKFVKDYIDLLMKIIQAQDDLSLVLTNARRYASGYVPTALFYEGCVRYKYIFKDEDATYAVKWAHTQLSTEYGECNLSVLELVLASCAIALIAITQSQNETFVTGSCQQLVPALRVYLDSNRQSIKFRANECAAKNRLHVRLVFQHAMSSICDSLSKLSGSRRHSDACADGSHNELNAHDDADAIRSDLANMLQEQEVFNDVLWKIKFPDGVPIPRQRASRHMQWSPHPVSDEI